MTLSVFDEDEETFFENIPHPEALTRGVLHVGETWKLAANVQYLRDIMEQAELEHTEAVQNAHDDHDDDYSNGVEEGERDRTIEIEAAINRILDNNAKDWKSEIELYFQELQGFDQVKG